MKAAALKMIPAAHEFWFLAAVAWLIYVMLAH